MASYRSIQNQAAFLSNLHDVITSLTLKPVNICSKRMQIITDFEYDRERGMVEINYSVESHTRLTEADLEAAEDLVIVIFEKNHFQVTSDNDGNLYGVYSESMS